MKNLFILLFLSILYSFNFYEIYCYRSMRFSSLHNNNINQNNNNNNINQNNNNENSDEKPVTHIAEELKGIDNITQELVNNDIEEGEEEDDKEDEEEEEKTSFDSIAHKSIQNIEGEAIIDLENAEMENLLDNEIFRVVQDRLKKLWYIGYCRRDYTNLCPLGWNKSSYDENLCIPPASYEGPCRSMDFENSQPKDKELFAWKCEVEWPCIKYPSQNVMEKCPVRWTNVGNNLCIAPEDYNGECSPAIDFSNFDFDMRIRWSVLCNFEWPIDLNKKVLNKKNKINTSLGGPIEEDGNIIKLVHTYNN